MARPDRSSLIDAALLEAVGRHPRDLILTVANALNLSRAAVSARARELVAQGYLRREGNTRAALYYAGANRRRLLQYARAGLAEDRVWTRDVASLLEGVPKNVVDIAHHGLTEMVNNAIDHSEGERVQVLADVTDTRVLFVVADDGVGIFHKITRALDLPDERLALLELSKGKLTTDPRRHSGEGIFFTSKMFDKFEIHSGDLVFRHDGEDDVLYDDATGKRRTGTMVAMEIAHDSTRDISEVFGEFSSGPDEYAFAKTMVPVRLARVGDENLISRSQAKRLLQRVDRFRHVVLDFEGVERIGQAFADEIFRVFALEHPRVELVATHAVPEVQQMIRRAEVLRDETQEAS